MMDNYEERIASFAGGKQLQRLRQPVRRRGDGFCDACGSPQPSTLYGLRDKAGDRVYFVGSTCLQELSRKGVVVRPFGKISAAAAYEAEMQRRDEETTASKPIGGTASKRRQKPTLNGGMKPGVTGSTSYTPAVVAYETSEHYHAVVTLANSAAQVLSVGSAVEKSLAEDREAPLRGSLKPQLVNHPRPDALIRCVLRAWDQAVEKLDVDQYSAPSPEDLDTDLKET